MNPLLRGILVATVVTFCFSFPAMGQSHSGPERQTTRAEESKGEVDHMVEELAKKNETVLRRCLENCNESQLQAEQNIKVGQIVNKVVPAYPPLARAAHVSGVVVVMLIVDEEGNVIATQADSGHPLLFAAALKAARESTFTPTLLAGKPVKVLGTVSYNFVAR